MEETINRSNPYCMLFRDISDFNCINIERFCAIDSGFPVYNLRSKIPKNSVVIGRYSVLPYYNELVDDLKTNNSTLINTYNQHKYISNCTYVNTLFAYTPKTYFESDFYMLENNKQYIVKGCTNSKKFEWNTKMFAKNKEEALNIASELKRDGILSEQDIIIREYVPLETFEIGLNGLPFTNEWRVFCLNGKILSHGYYWDIAEDADEYNKQDITDGLQFIKWNIMGMLRRSHCCFYVLDIAKKQNGEWILVEMNDAQMSGLSMNDPLKLYTNLYYALNNQ